MNLGADTFAILPQGTMTTLLPIATANTVPMVGVPALDNTLVGSAYDLTGAAVTGPMLGTPMSVVTGIETTTASDPITVGGFFAVPTLVEPAAATWSGTHVNVQAAGAIDLVSLSISSANGLVVWQIIAPGSDLSFDLPDLSQVPGVGTLIHGPIATTLSIARIDQFDYGTLRSGQLATSAWNAYAQDTIAASY